MRRVDKIWLAIAVAATFFAVGIPFWLIPYHEVNLPDALWHYGLLVASLSALLLCSYGVASFWRATSMVAAAVVAPVLVRILVGGIMDPTSHNLWPFEVVIALMVGAIAAVAGAITGHLVARSRLNRRKEKSS